MDTKEQINFRKKLFKILSKTYNSENIILFGSYAYGTPDEDSDIDVAVIVKESDLPQYKRSRVGYSKVRGIGHPVEILVYTEDEVKRLKNVRTSLVSTIINKGLKLNG